jgi:hypothetical protein
LLATTKPRMNVLQVANIRAYPPPGDLLAMSHVLDDNVAPENRGGRRKFADTEGIVLMKEIVANDTHCVPAWQGD